jgi:hypothetical protein
MQEGLQFLQLETTTLPVTGENKSDIKSTVESEEQAHILDKGGLGKSPSDYSKRDDSNNDSIENKNSQEDNGAVEYNGVPEAIIEPLFDSIGIPYDASTDKFSNLQEFGEYIRELIEINKPTIFASEEVEMFNKHVANGGSLKDYYEQEYSDNDQINNISDEDLVRFDLRESKWSTDKIELKIQKLKDGNDLEWEAEQVRNKYNLVLEEERNIRNANRAELEKQGTRKIEQARVDLYNNIMTQNDIYGNKMTKSKADNIYTSIFSSNEEGIDTINAILGDPSKLSMLIQLDEINWDFNKLIKYTKSDATKEAFKKIQASAKNNSGVKSVDRETNNKSEQDFSFLSNFGKNNTNNKNILESARKYTK